MNSVHVQDNLVISGSDDGVVTVWNMESDRKLWEFNHENSVLSMIVRDDWVITCCKDKSVTVLHLDTGHELHRLEHPSVCNNADLNPNKSLLAVACDSAVVVWDMKKQIKIGEFELAPEIRDLRFNPAGDKLIVGAFEGEIFEIAMK